MQRRLSATSERGFRGAATSRRRCGRGAEGLLARGQASLALPVPGFLRFSLAARACSTTRRHIARRPAPETSIFRRLRRLRSRRSPFVSSMAFMRKNRGSLRKPPQDLLSVYDAGPVC